MIKYKSTILNSLCKNLFFKHDAGLHLNRVIFKQEASCVTVTPPNTTTRKVFSFLLHRLYRINLLCPNELCRMNDCSSEFRAPLFLKIYYFKERVSKKNVLVFQSFLSYYTVTAGATSLTSFFRPEQLCHICFLHFLSSLSAVCNKEKKCCRKRT